MSLWWKIALCVIACYLLGSVNGAIIVSKLRMHEDVREKGSGNAGLTNFLRSYGGWLTLLVVVIDMGKVVAGCLLAQYFLKEIDPPLARMIAGVTVQVGHIFPVFFGFRGVGKISSRNIRLFCNVGSRNVGKSRNMKFVIAIRINSAKLKSAVFLI